MKKVLDKFFYPKSVALVGATEKPEKIGYTVLRNLLENGYGGTVYPVNPKYRKLQGKKCYAHLRNLPKAPDLVLFALPAALVPPQMAACREIGAQCAVVIASDSKKPGKKAKAVVPRPEI
ncbi:MAG: CoA-binding protein [Lewinellaceae bacterium]|nr:CoA-binding protein [Lewinellaceae bacterium]